jgi:hypothetical protein
MAFDEKTSPRVASLASELLRSPFAPTPVKSVSGSALTQAPDHDNALARYSLLARTRRNALAGPREDLVNALAGYATRREIEQAAELLSRIYGPETTIEQILAEYR